MSLVVALRGGWKRADFDCCNSWTLAHQTRKKNELKKKQKK
jgi:hypothetical protein